MSASSLDVVLRSSFSSSVTSDRSYGANLSDVPDASPIDRLPREVMHRIFMEVIANDGYNFHWMTEFSCVSRRWRSLCQHPVMWDFVAKRIFVIYPFVERLKSTPWDRSSQEIVNRMRLVHSEEQNIMQYDPFSPLRAPTRTTLYRAMDRVRRFRARQQYYRYVQRRRSLVLNIFLSITLLSLSLSLGAATCAAEGVEDLGSFCTRGTVFTFLWICYLSIIGIIVSNVVMAAHFEPSPLLPRLRNNRLLIAASAATLLLGIFDVMIPTLLVQINMSRQDRFSWMWCGVTVILSLCAWQAYAIFCMIPEARVQLHHQLAAIDAKEGFHFVAMNVPNAFPIFFAITAICTAQYVQYGSRFYILISGVPVIVALAVLVLVFLMDFVSLRHSKDLSVSMCLLMAMIFPISLLIWEFRGWSLVPLVCSAFGFFLSHARYVVSSTLSEFLMVRRRERAAAAAAAVPVASDVSRPSSTANDSH